MRLLARNSDHLIELTQNFHEDIPRPYAILSHTWGADLDEVRFVDLQQGQAQDKLGYAKIQFCAEQAERDGIKYFWVDTCCINKADLSELSESITLMFKWYQQAAKCYVYLSDVSIDNDIDYQSQHHWEQAFRNSRWFRRGWTLQELLAPSSAEFFSQEGRQLGSKKTLEALIHEITRIPVSALRGAPLSQFTVDERFRWTEGRQTRKVEDLAYCLLGIFDVSMSLRYGEGDKALARLRSKVEGSAKIKDTGKYELINWLAPCRPQNIHAKMLASRHPNTGVSFTTRTFMSWLTNEDDWVSLMWVTGKSGTGKTTLFSHLVETTKTFIGNTSSSALAFHYCTFSDSTSQQLVNILGSFLVQLPALNRDILTDMEAIFKRDQAGRQGKTLQAEELEQILIRHVSKLGSAILMLDALDESQNFPAIVDCLTRLLGHLPDLKVLVTSTRRVPIDDEDQIFRSVEVQMDSEEDIRRFTEARLANHPALRHLSTECKAKVRSTLMGRADQTFRWVSLTLENICRQRTGKAVMKALEEAPQGLNNIYRNMVGRIPELDRPIAHKVLLWASFAIRPLTLLELSEAAILDPSDTTLNQDSRLARPDTILDICHGFLDYNADTGEVKLAHSSVRDYLLSQTMDGSHEDSFLHLKADEGNRKIMHSCLTYLMFEDFQVGVATTAEIRIHRQQKFPLLSYAAHYWAMHTEFATQTEWNLVMELFSTRRIVNGGNYGNWVSCIMPHHDVGIVLNTDPLYYAASLGWTTLVRELLTKATLNDIEHPGGRTGSTALQVACFRGRQEVAELLLAAGADFWTIDRGSKESAWFWALSNGWVRMVNDMIRLKPEIAKQVRVDVRKLVRARVVQEIYTEQLHGLTLEG